MRVFVAGATGVLGRRLIPLLRADAHEIVAVSRSDEKSAQLRSAGAEPVRVDLFDPRAVNKAVAGSDVIINVATHIPAVKDRAKLSAWKENTRVRSEVSKNLADAAREQSVPRMIQESIWLVHDDGGPDWIDESGPMRTTPMTSPSAVAEANVLPLNDAEGHTAVVLRFGEFYGTDSGQFKAQIEAIRKGKIGLIGKPDHYLARLDLDDAAAALVAALDAPGGIYDVVDNDPPTRAEFVDTVASALGAPAIKFPAFQPLLLLGDKRIAGTQRSLRISNKKLRAATSWSPRWERSLDGIGAVAKQLA